MWHIKLHGNPKTNVKAKTNPNRSVPKTSKKTWKKHKKNNCAHRESNTDRCGAMQTLSPTELPRQLTLVLIFGLLTYITKQKMQ